MPLARSSTELACSVQDGDGSWISADPLRTVPECNKGFCERSRIRIQAPPGGGWEFRVDDQPLQPSDAAGRPGWLWEPNFYAGEVTAELIDADGRQRASYLLDVSPDPDKLGRDFYDEMIAEIMREDPTLVLGDEPASIAIGQKGSLSNLHLQLARLRRYGPSFVTALGVVARRPRRVLIRRREQVPIEKVRRIDRLTALQACRQRAITPLFAEGGSIEDETPAFERITLDVPMTERHLDSPANRLMLFLARSVMAKAGSVRRQLGKLVEREQRSETTTDLASRWPAREAFLRRLRIDLRRLTARTPWNSVRRPEISSAGLNAASADPAYARAFGQAWKILRPGVSGALSDERLWISPTWEVYERWCFVALARRLRQCHAALDWRRSEGPRGALAEWTGEGVGLRVRFTLQPEFRGGPSWARGRRSVSHTRYPDIVLEIESEEGRRFAILDAKYSVRKEAVTRQMASAHLYNDSLRIDGERTSVALLLTPASTGASWLEEHDFIHRHGVGVVCFGPDEGADRVETLHQVLRYGETRAR
jgi:hypothetical protein